MTKRGAEFRQRRGGSVAGCCGSGATVHPQPSYRLIRILVFSITIIRVYPSISSYMYVIKLTHIYDRPIVDRTRKLLNARYFENRLPFLFLTVK